MTYIFNQAIKVKTLRTLSESEKNTIKYALERMADLALKNNYQASARMMLEQRMVDNFMWGTE